METTARSSEDLIGIVPHTLGYTPRRSLVAIIVSTDGGGTQSVETTMRIDFDRETAAHIVRESGRWYVDLVLDACVPSGVFLVLYDDDYLDSIRRAAFGEQRSPDEYPFVHRDLIRTSIDEIARAFDEHGVDTLSAWWVSENRFGRIDDPDDAGTPLEQAESSACATELVAAGSSPVSSPAALVVRPVVDTELIELRRGGTWMGIESGFGVLARSYPQLIELCSQGAELSSQILSEILTPRLVMAIDSILTQMWSRDALEMILSFNHPNFQPRDVLDQERGALFARAGTFGRSAEAARQMIGLTDTVPHPKDLRVSIEFLKAYAGRAHPEVRPTAYAMIAWFEWVSGGSTMAEQYALAALAEDGEHRMAALMLSAVQNGVLPQWLRKARKTRSPSNSPSRE